MPKIRVIEGGLAGLDTLMAEFEAQGTYFEFNTDPSIPPTNIDPAELESLLGYDPSILGDLGSLDLSGITSVSAVISEGTMQEFEDMLDPDGADEFIFKKGPFLVDLD